MSIVSARPTGAPLGMKPAPYQPGPPQEYLEAVTNKRLTEEVSWWYNEISVLMSLCLFVLAFGIRVV